MAEQRKTKRLFTRIPVRVQGRDEMEKPFVEETTTLEVSRDGARVPLRVTPRFGARLEMTNLSTQVTTVALVTHRCPQSYSGLAEWGLEFADPVPDFWSIAFQETREGQPLVVSALLACQRCGRKEMVNLSSAQYEGLGEEYFLSRACPVCGASTQWQVVAREEEEPSALAVAGANAGAAGWDDRRTSRRLALKAPILITTTNGSSEAREAQDLSKFGLSFTASLELKAGDRIEVSIGHGVAETPSLRKCLVVWRKPREKSGQYLYGVKFLD
jgi:hypothetical protein